MRVIFFIRGSNGAATLRYILSWDLPAIEVTLPPTVGPASPSSTGSPTPTSKTASSLRLPRQPIQTRSPPTNSNSNHVSKLSRCPGLTSRVSTSTVQSVKRGIAGGLAGFGAVRGWNFWKFWSPVPTAGFGGAYHQ